MIEEETETRRRAAYRHALVAEVHQRGLGLAVGARSTANYLAQLLHLGPGEARARVAAAEDLGPRRGLTGEPLAPIYPAAAAALAAGEISERHTAAIITAVEALPDVVRKEWEEQVETDLVDLARRFDPVSVAKAGQRIKAILDPDGVLEDVEHRHARRHVTPHRRGDGTMFGTFDLDVECAEKAAVMLAALAGPRPEVDGVKDRRSAGQRNHDALLDLFDAVLRAEQLPDKNGVTATVIVTVPADQLATGEGVVSTGTGAQVPTAEALRWASRGSRWFTTVLDRALHGATKVAAHGVACRLFTESQRLALIARDKGCSFPGCDAPPWLCQAHHVLDWARGGPTSIDNGTLLCGYHHREFLRLGWTCTMIDAVPHWTAPAWLDAEQTPVRNTAHDPP